MRVLSVLVALVVFLVLCVDTADAQVRVRARRGANVAVTQNFGGGGGAQAFAARSYGAVGFGARAFAVPRQKVFVQRQQVLAYPQVQVQAFAVPVYQQQILAVPQAQCVQSFGVLGGCGGGAAAFAY